MPPHFLEPAVIFADGGSAGKLEAFVCIAIIGLMAR